MPKFQNVGLAVITKDCVNTNIIKLLKQAREIRIQTCVKQTHWKLYVERVVYGKARKFGVERYVVLKKLGKCEVECSCFKKVREI